MKKLVFTFLISLFCGVMAAYAQGNVSGTVFDDEGEPLIGVSVFVKGTKNGTVTDFDGNYNLLNVPSNGTLTFSYVGMQPIEIKVDGKSKIDAIMKEDHLGLEEVVVIGYGSAKAKDLTSPITTISGSDIANIPTSNPMSALAGKVPGVNVINSGVPGEGPVVQIRGVGSFEAASPLYVVDGMFYDNINWLDNDDIQDISIMKDASSAAIYGVKAANGVVIVTTKKGSKNQKAKVSYNGYVGFQKATHVIKMANSSQYAQMLMEANPEAYASTLQASIDLWGGNLANYTFGANTDWYKEMLRDAVITNHNLSISGGSEKATYSVGMSYLYQNGIMKGDNSYNRLNFRAQLDYEATNWLKVGFSGVFANSHQRSPNNEAWEEAFKMPSIMPVYDDNNASTFPDKFASPESIGLGSNFRNPMATIAYNKNKNNNYQAMTNFYADFIFIPSKLDLRTSYGYDFASTSGLAMVIPYYVTTSQQNTTSHLTKTDDKWNKWAWDNVLTYRDTWGESQFGAMLGFSLREENWRQIVGQAYNVPYEKEEWWYLSNGNQDTRTSSDGGYRYRSASWFARLNYNYDNRYLLMFTFRADGSSKYQEKWGYFPSIGAAWTISNEKFMEGQTWADYLKLRASWGLLGNDKVPASFGTASLETGNGNSGVFGAQGTANGLPVPGYYYNSSFSYLKWEKVSETNIGISYATLGSRLSAEIDWYYRLTNDAVMTNVPQPIIQWPLLTGNWGQILNTGVDINLNWNDKVGNFSYFIGANISTLKNEVKKINRFGLDYVLTANGINKVGEKMNSFYGYEVVGVYQNWDEINADPIAVANGVEPGWFKYKDQNGDGVLDNDDKTTLGAYIPSFTYGINFGFEIKGFDFAISTYGQTGAKMLNWKSQMRYQQGNYNFTYDQFKNRWTGEGSTNKYPSAAALMNTWNTPSSGIATNSYYVMSADFFRIQNISLGYTFRNIKMGAYTMPSLRLSLTADRPCSFFKADSFSPELSGENATSGWDNRVYPLSSTFTFGLQMDF